MKYPLQVSVTRVWQGSTFNGFRVVARIEGVVVEDHHVHGTELAYQLRRQLKRKYAPVRDAIKETT